MDKKFLDKVVDQIVGETKITKGKYGHFIIHAPFSVSSTNIVFLHHQKLKFWDHCKNVYGLNDDEIEYAWERYNSLLGVEIIYMKYKIDG